MSDIKSVFKSGWHPKGKDGGKESWRGDYKGINQVAGWVGKGKQPNSSAQSSSHVSRPLTTLKDPAAFGPPPKNVNYHGGAALPHEITPNTGGIGAPLTQTEVDNARSTPHQTYRAELDAQETSIAAPPPPLPFRADRTGLQTSNLPPPPPARRNPSSPDVQQAFKASPGLPPRLPSRQNTASPTTNAVSPPSYDAVPQMKSSVPTPTLNQSAMNRLGNAGITVPSLGIGKDTTERNQGQGNSNTVSELQSRFKRFNTNSSSTTPDLAQDAVSPANQAQATPPVPSWKQTQSTFRTAQNFHKDPSSVTLADAQQAANTAQSAHANATAFHAKHADKFDAAERKATTFNKKHNVTGRLNRFLEDANDEHDKTQQQQQQQQQQASQPQAAYSNNSATAAATSTPAHLYQRQLTQPGPQQESQQPPQTQTETLSASIARKPPPPPPPKKPGNLQAAPPVPLGTKPR